MFSNGNCGIPVTMNVEPTNSGNNGGNGCWGDNGAWWIIIFVLFFAFGGWGNGGWGNNSSGNGGTVPYMVGSTYTDAAIARGFDTQTIVGKLDGINAGICDSTFSLNNAITNGFAGVNNAVCDLGFNVAQSINGVNTNIMQGNFGLQQAINNASVANMQGQNALQAQLANCCCENRAGQKDIQYQMAADTCAVQNTIQNTTRDIIDNQNSNSKQILDFLVNDKISTLQAENQTLRLAASQANQNNVLMAAMDANTAEILRKTGAECPTAAYIVQPPQPVTFPTNCCGGVNYATYGNNGGCGCNSGCC